MIKGLTSILLPSAYRPYELARCLTALYAAEYTTPIEVLVSLVDDAESQAIIKQFPVHQIIIRTPEEYQLGSHWVWNELGRRSRGEFITALADDVVVCRRWLILALDQMHRLRDDGLVGFNDLSSDGEMNAAHWLAARKFLIEHCGGCVYCPKYRAWWGDREITEIAKKIDRYVWARCAIVEHLHWNWGKSEIDRTYRDAQPWHLIDQKVYEARKAAGFPHDFDAVLTG